MPLKARGRFPRQKGGDGEGDSLLKAVSSPRGGWVMKCLSKVRAERAGGDWVAWGGRSSGTVASLGAAQKENGTKAVVGAKGDGPLTKGGEFV